MTPSEELDRAIDEGMAAIVVVLGIILSAAVIGCCIMYLAVWRFPR
jgi:hypothetical protein